MEFVVSKDSMNSNQRLNTPSRLSINVYTSSSESSFLLSGTDRVGFDIFKESAGTSENTKTSTETKIYRKNGV